MEQIQQAQAQHRLVMEPPQIPPFDQGNLAVLIEFLEKMASLENRRQKAKLAGDPERMNEIKAAQKKLAQTEQWALLRKFELVRWGRILLGALAQGAVMSVVITLIYYAFARQWSISPLTLILFPLMWVFLIWNIAPPVMTVTGSPKRARKLGRALSRKTQTAGVYALVARPWLTAVVFWKMPRQLWQAYKAEKAAKAKKK
ncbi:MAG: hypothetical protein A3F68_08080 [Acidobacteria bacterium RIFCSPLOWO2_12_FULL_54_10]|nr:MAG: hypothetical protein A3F68_08080 [Acidobacteria bacterium RIFCSPLOWO2_12_FULL_54_10]